MVELHWLNSKQYLAPSIHVSIYFRLTSALGTLLVKYPPLRIQWAQLRTYYPPLRALPTDFIVACAWRIFTAPPMCRNALRQYWRLLQSASRFDRRIFRMLSLKSCCVQLRWDVLCMRSVHIAHLLLTWPRSREPATCRSVVESYSHAQAPHY